MVSCHLSLIQDCNNEDFHKTRATTPNVYHEDNILIDKMDIFQQYSVAFCSMLILYCGFCSAKCVKAVTSHPVQGVG